MTKLVFKSAENPRHAKDIEIDTADVLAVQDIGCKPLTGGIFAHRRNVYTADSQMVVWEMSNSSTPPSSIAKLDKLGGKLTNTFAKTDSTGQSQLVSANAIIVSVEPDDLKMIKRVYYKEQELSAGTGVNGAFTKSSRPEQLAKGNKMGYGEILLGDDTNAVRVPIASLRLDQFKHFEAV